MALQGYARFGQLTQILSFSFTLSLGVAPSVARLVVPPVRQLQLYSDAMEIQYGSVRIIWPDCRVDRIEPQLDSEGREVWVLTILDRRWRWREAGSVSGYYNVRRDHHKIVSGTEKAPQDLARICLEAMGETRYDVRQLPNEPRPEIEWDYQLPSEALARLCDDLGCRVALSLDNRVRIVRLGIGAPLPPLPVLEGTESLDPPDPPERLVIVGDRVRYQADLPLEAVGLERNGDVVPIDKLSYAPKIAGKARWYDIDHFNDVADQKNRRVARESVLRWYRVAAPLRLPGVAADITSIDRILPLEDRQLQTRVILGRKEPLQPWVYGKFYDGDTSARPAEDEVEGDVLAKPNGFYYRGFSIDHETGIVKFSDPVYTLTFDNTTPYGYIATPAVLRLRVAVGLRDPVTRGWQRNEYTRVVKAKKKSKVRWVRYVIHEDIKREVYYQHAKPAGLIDNAASVQKMSSYYWDLAAAEYEPDMAASLSYPGFLAISPDGAIQQVTW